jgi:hypothetical protein
VFDTGRPGDVVRSLFGDVVGVGGRVGEWVCHTPTLGRIPTSGVSESPGLFATPTGHGARRGVSKWARSEGL